jgi:hypothetical protein
MTMDIGNRWLELRVRNNYASVVTDDDPRQANEMFQQALAVARDIGDRQMFNWLLGNVAGDAMSTGEGWDEVLRELEDSLAGATLPADRVRLLVFLSLLRGARGEPIDGLLDDILEITRDRVGIDMRFPAVMAQAHRALCAGDPEAGFRFAVEAIELDGQNPEIGAIAAFRAAVVGGNPDRIREAAGYVRVLPGTGAWTNAFRRHAEAAVAGLDGRAAEAAGEHVAAYETMDGLGQHVDAAVLATGANLLLPGRAELRPIAERARETLTRAGARVWLSHLERALASAPSGSTADAPATASAEVAAE